MKKIFIILPLFFILSVNAEDKKAGDKEGPTASTESKEVIIDTAQFVDITKFFAYYRQTEVDMWGKALVIGGLSTLVSQLLFVIRGSEPEALVTSAGVAAGFTGCYLMFRSMSLMSKIDKSDKSKEAPSKEVPL